MSLGILDADVYRLTVIDLAKRIGGRWSLWHGLSRSSRRRLHSPTAILQLLDSVSHRPDSEQHVSVCPNKVLDLGRKKVDLSSHDGRKERVQATTQRWGFSPSIFFKKRSFFSKKYFSTKGLIRPFRAADHTYILKFQIGWIGLDIDHIPQLGVFVRGAGVLRAGNRLNVGKSGVLECVVVDGNS